jgi:hypothetical protein
MTVYKQTNKHTHQTARISSHTGETKANQTEFNENNNTHNKENTRRECLVVEN